MSVIRHIWSVRQGASPMPLLAVAIVAAQLACGPVNAATLGHSRLVSQAGEPLRITIPVTQITAAEIDSLRIVPAPLSAWGNTGLTPPVDLATLQTRLTDGYAPDTRVIQVWSDQVFNQPIADLLLDIHTSSGVQRYQVSLLARGGATAIQAPATSAAGSAAPGVTDSATIERTASQKPILVRRGDTMLAVAGRHAVSGVSVYQMMIALQRANPHAFIQNNLNLVRAGEQLVMPDRDALTAISDREARRLFHEQVVAFNAYRQGRGESASGEFSTTPPPGGSEQAGLSADSVSNVPPSRLAQGDQLRLSSGRGSSVAVSRVPDTAMADDQIPRQMSPGATSESAVGRLSQPVVSEVAGVTQAGQGNGVSDMADSDAAPAVSNGVSAAASATESAVVSESQRATQAVQNGGAGVHEDGSRADDELALRKGIADAEQRVSQLEKNVKNLNRALQSQGQAAQDLVVDGAIGLRQSLSDVATAVTDATIGGEEFLDGSLLGESDSVTPEGTSETRQANTTASMMSSITTWLSANLLAVITGLLALAVLLIAWILRRANITQSRAESAVTPEMVKEKLDQINLDLSDPTIDDTPSSRS